ncbi:MAG: FeoB-associated Cys-rich membrane protein [Acidobacteriota bacterium]
MEIQYIFVGIIIVAALFFVVRGTVRRVRPMVSEKACEADCGCSSSNAGRDKILT